MEQSTKLFIFAMFCIFLTGSLVIYLGFGDYINADKYCEDLGYDHIVMFRDSSFYCKGYYYLNNNTLEVEEKITKRMLIK